MNKIKRENTIVRGDIIFIKDNLHSKLEELNFGQDAVDRTNQLVNTQQIAMAIWSDEDGQEYITVDLCVEIPIQCCELVKGDTYE